MEYVTLGRTGQTVSRLGLGCGGPSRLGHAAGLDADDRVAIVIRALELGVTHIDTARSYGTEEIVARAIDEVRPNDLFISTKSSAYLDDRRVLTPGELAGRIEQSLRALGVNAIDLFHLHGVLPSQYASARDILVPELIRQRKKGNIRFFGVTERFNADPGHAMLSQAMNDDCWDVIMVGFNPLNQSARDRVLAPARAKNIGVQAMFVVRKAFSIPERLREVLAGLIEAGRIDGDEIDMSDPLGFLVKGGAAESLPDAAYRFCRDEAGIDVVLSGTGRVEHLEANIASITAPSLPGDLRQRLVGIFDGVDSVTAQ
jgi:aryl-alcohol dehydrogenase-like predicted oxidoreductase